MALQNTFYFDVDLKQPTYIQEPRVTQNDEVTFVLRVFDDGVPFTLSDISTYALASQRKDKQSVLTNGTKTGDNEITFTLGTTELTVPGKVKAAIQLYDVDGRVSSIPFTYNVLDDLSAGYIPSMDEQTLIELVLGEGPTILADAQAATITANTAAGNANDKASIANTAATNANNKADLANTAATNAETKAQLADQKATLADEKATYATTQGDYAKAKGDEAASIIANGPVSSVNGQTGAITGLATTVELQTLDSETIKGNSGTKYKIVAGILRCVNGVWSLVNDESHKPINIESATFDADKITINFSFVASKIGTLVCVPDETYIKNGINFGSSVAASSAEIRANINKTIGGYISYNGTSFNVSNADGVVGAEWSSISGIPCLTITHNEIYAKNVFKLSAIHRGGNHIVQVDGYASSSTSLDIGFFDFNGVRIETPNTNMKFFFEKTASGDVDITKLGIPNSNIWIYGIFEIN